MISASLWPCLSFSRTCSRRSTASGALESAIVWFWQTRQRSSSASVIARFSSCGSAAAAGGASFAWSANESASAGTSARTSAGSLGIALELADERQDLRLENLGGHDADLLVA